MKPSEFLKEKSAREQVKELDKRFIDKQRVTAVIEKRTGSTTSNLILEELGLK